MRWKLIDTTGSRAYVVLLDPGDDAVALLSGFATDRQLTAAQVTAVGAFQQATVGWFDRSAKRYQPIKIDEQCEVLSLIGDVALGASGRPQLHLHAVLGLSDGSTRGRAPAWRPGLAHARGDHPRRARRAAQDRPARPGSGADRPRPVNMAAH
jgi:uncharacterized protein